MSEQFGFQIVQLANGFFCFSTARSVCSSQQLGQFAEGLAQLALSELILLKDLISHLFQICKFSLISFSLSFAANIISLRSVAMPNILLSC
jgi:hypothetical protein